MKKLLLVALILIFGSAGAHAQAVDQRLMTDDEYKTFLSQTEAALPRLERGFKRSDKDSQAVGLAEIHTIRALYLDAEHPRPRTLSSEIDLCGFLQRLYVNAAVAQLYTPELQNLVFRLNDDIHAQLASRHL